MLGENYYTQATKKQKVFISRQVWDRMGKLHWKGLYSIYVTVGSIQI